MADLYNNFLNSVSMVVDSVTDNLNYNKTSICTVLEVLDDNKYLVTDSASKFEAYSSTDTIYKINDIVYVLIPNDDTEEKKWIIQSIGSGEDDGYEEVDPQGAFEDIDFTYENSHKYSLLANGATSNLVVASSSSVIDNHNNTFICLAADFNVSIPKANEGTFGVKLTLNTGGKEGTQVFTLDPSAMTGKIYTQEHTQALFSNIISDELIGYKIEIFQNNDFLYTNGNSVTYNGMNNEDYTNIKISNICFYIGESSRVTDEFSKIHFSQLKEETGVIIGRKQTEGGMYGYNNKNIVASFGPNNEAILGKSDIGYIKANSEKTEIKGNFNFNLINEEKEEEIYTDSNEKIIFNQVNFSPQTLQLSKTNIEKNTFIDFFNATWRDGANVITTKKIVYYIGASGKDSNDGLTPNTSFFTLEPIKKLCSNGAKNFVVNFLTGGVYDLTVLNKIKTLTCTFTSKATVTFTSLKDIIFYNSNIIFNGNFIFRLSSLKNRLGYINFGQSILYCDLYIEGGTFEGEGGSIDKCYIKHSQASFKNFIIKSLKGVNSNIEFNKCTLQVENAIVLNLLNCITTFLDNTTLTSSKSKPACGNLIIMSGGKMSILSTIEKTFDECICSYLICNEGGAILAKEDIINQWKEVGNIKYNYFSINGVDPKDESLKEADYAMFYDEWVAAGKPVITMAGGVNNGPSGLETYYNMNMTGVIQLMNELGYSSEQYPYSIDGNGAKKFGDYIMVGADLSWRPKGTILLCSLGMAIVVDTSPALNGSGESRIDIAVNWGPAAS